MEHDIYDSLRFIATTCEKMEDALNAIAEYFEKVTACLMDLIEGIKRQSLKMILQKLRPDYKDKCKIRWLDIPNKVMQGENQEVLITDVCSSCGRHFEAPTEWWVRKRAQYTNIPDGVITTCPHCENVTIVREVKPDE